MLDISLLRQLLQCLGTLILAGVSSQAAPVSSCIEFIVLARAENEDSVGRHNAWAKALVVNGTAARSIHESGGYESQWKFDLATTVAQEAVRVNLENISGHGFLGPNVGRFAITPDMVRLEESERGCLTRVRIRLTGVRPRDFRAAGDFHSSPPKHAVLGTISLKFDQPQLRPSHIVHGLSEIPSRDTLLEAVVSRIAGKGEEEISVVKSGGWHFLLLRDSPDSPTASLEYFRPGSSFERVGILPEINATLLSLVLGRVAAGLNQTSLVRILDTPTLLLKEPSESALELVIFEGESDEHEFFLARLEHSVRITNAKAWSRLSIKPMGLLSLLRNDDFELKALSLGGYAYSIDRRGSIESWLSTGRRRVATLFAYSNETPGILIERFVTEVPKPDERSGPVKGRVTTEFGTGVTLTGTAIAWEEEDQLRRILYLPSNAGADELRELSVRSSADVKVSEAVQWDLLELVSPGSGRVFDLVQVEGRLFALAESELFAAPLSGRGFSSWGEFPARRDLTDSQLSFALKDLIELRAQGSAKILGSEIISHADEVAGLLLEIGNRDPDPRFFFAEGSALRRLYVFSSRPIVTDVVGEALADRTPSQLSAFARLVAGESERDFGPWELSNVNTVCFAYRSGRLFGWEQRDFELWGESVPRKHHPFDRLLNEIVERRQQQTVRVESVAIIDSKEDWSAGLARFAYTGENMEEVLIASKNGGGIGPTVVKQRSESLDNSASSWDPVIGFLMANQANEIVLWNLRQGERFLLHRDTLFALTPQGYEPAGREGTTSGTEPGFHSFLQWLSYQQSYKRWLNGSDRRPLVQGSQKILDDLGLLVQLSERGEYYLGALDQERTRSSRLTARGVNPFNEPEMIKNFAELLLGKEDKTKEWNFTDILIGFVNRPPAYYAIGDEAELWVYVDAGSAGPGEPENGGHYVLWSEEVNMAKLDLLEALIADTLSRIKKPRLEPVFSSLRSVGENLLVAWFNESKIGPRLLSKKEGQIFSAKMNRLGDVLGAEDRIAILETIVDSWPSGEFHFLAPGNDSGDPDKVFMIREAESTKMLYEWSGRFLGWGEIKGSVDGLVEEFVRRVAAANSSRDRTSLLQSFDRLENMLIFSTGGDSGPQQVLARKEGTFIQFKIDGQKVNESWSEVLDRLIPKISEDETIFALVDEDEEKRRYAMSGSELFLWSDEELALLGPSVEYIPGTIAPFLKHVRQEYFKNNNRENLQYRSWSVTSEDVNALLVAFQEEDSKIWVFPDAKEPFEDSELRPLIDHESFREQYISERVANINKDFIILSENSVEDRLERMLVWSGLKKDKDGSISAWTGTELRQMGSARHSAFRSVRQHGQRNDLLFSDFYDRLVSEDNATVLALHSCGFALEFGSSQEIVLIAPAQHRPKTLSSISVLGRNGHVMRWAEKRIDDAKEVFTPKGPCARPTLSEEWSRECFRQMLAVTFPSTIVDCGELDDLMGRPCEEGMLEKDSGHDCWLWPPEWEKLGEP